MSILTYIPRSIKPATSVMLYGVGNSDDTFKWSDADRNLVGIWGETSANSGDSRVIYTRLYFAGQGSGEAMRAYGTVTNAAAATGGTVNGLHASLSIAVGGAVSGAGNAIRATLDAAAATRTLGGTLAAIQVDSNIGTGNTLPATAAFIRVTDTGNVRLCNLMNVPAPANGTMFAAHTTDAMTHSLKIVDASGTAYYVMCTTTATNRS